MSPGRQVALYYPAMIPPTSWLKHALLLHDATSSIVHPEFDHQVRMGDLAEPHAREAQEMQWLYREDLWRPTTVEYLFRGRREWQAEVLDALRQFADNPEYRFEGGYFPPLPELTALYLGKLSHEIEDWLLELGLAKLDRFGGHVMVHQDVASAVLAITAKYIAAANDDIDVRMVPSTDDLPHHRLATGQLSNAAGRYRCIELLLSGIAPIPGAAASFQDIVAFRRRHGDELSLFRAELDAMLRRVRESEDPVDELRSARRDVEAALRQIERAAKTWKLQLVGGALTVTAVAATAVLLPAETVTWAFDGFGVVATAAVLTRSTRRPARHVSPYAYLLRVRREFQSS